MRVYLTIIVCLFLSFQEMVAQQDSQYTQYMFNGLVLNPAYAGSKGGLSAMAIYRHQWVNIDGAPKTLSGSIHAPITDKMGVGGYVESDWIGVHNRLSAFGSYSYSFIIGNGRLAAGIQGGVMYYDSNFTDVNTPGDVADPIYSQDYSKLLPNFGMGLYYHTPRYYVGVSVPHILEGEFQLDGSPDDIEPSRWERHYLFTGGVALPISEGLLLKPSTLIKWVPKNAPLSVDINLNLLLKEQLWIGVSHRWKDSFDFIVEYIVKNNAFDLRIGYSYDLTMTEISRFTSGSHEVMIGIDLKDNQRIAYPRYF